MLCACPVPPSVRSSVYVFLGFFVNVSVLGFLGHIVSLLVPLIVFLCCSLSDLPISGFYFLPHCSAFFWYCACVHAYAFACHVFWVLYVCPYACMPTVTWTVPVWPYILGERTKSSRVCVGYSWTLGPDRNAASDASWISEIVGFWGPNIQ